MINFREKVIIIKRYKSVWEPKTRASINMKDTRRNSRKRRSRRRTNQHKLSVLVITGVIFLMTALVVVGGISLRAKEKSYLAQETELKKQIDEEKARSQEIDDMEAYVGTDEYVEEIAKEKLGLVNENEIILKAKTNEKALGESPKLFCIIECGSSYYIKSGAGIRKLR